MNIERTAIIVLDPQNDFFTPNGKLFEAMEPVLSKYQVVKNINTLLEAGRKGGAKIILAPLSFAEGCPEAGPAPYGIMQAVSQAKAFIRGSWGADISELLTVNARDLTIPKNHISAFENTSLEAQLRKDNIENVVLCGGLTDVCVETTMRQAYDKRFNVFTIQDATATIDLEKHEQTVSQNFELFSKPLLTREFIQMINPNDSKAA